MFNQMIKIEPLKVMNSAQPKTPREAGNSLFQSLMQKWHDESFHGDNHIGFYQDITPGEKIIRASGEKHAGVESVERLLQTLDRLGLNGGQLKLKAGSTPVLVSFLQQRNISPERIAQLLASLKNQDGTINLDRLGSHLFSQLAGSSRQKEKMVIKSNDVPRLQTFLFQCGLGVEEVKTVVEKSINSKGDIGVSRLSHQLSLHFKGDHSESRLFSALKQIGIQPQTADLDPKRVESNLAFPSKEIPKTSLPSIEHQVRRELASLLRDRGIPPEEVKSLLETLSFKQNNVKPPGPLPALSTNLLDGVVISSGRDWQNNPWQEKIFHILRGEKHQAGTSHKKTGLANRDGSLNLNVFSNSGDRGSKNDLVTNLVTGKNLPEQGEIRHIFKGVSEKSHGQTRIQEPLGFEINLKKLEINPARIDSPSPTSQDQNLRHPLPGILERMVFMIRGGIQRSRLIIHPPELGRLDLDLSLKQGHLRVTLGAESMVVKELIEANLNQLRQQLANQGLLVEKFEVMLGLNDQKSAANRRGTGDGQRFPRSAKEPQTTPVSAVEEEEVPDYWTGRYQVDVRA